MLTSLMIPRKRFKAKKLLWALLIPLGILLTNLSANSPEIIEKYYSGVFYRLIGQGLSILTGILPFSLAEVLVLAAAAFLLVTLISIIVRIFRHSRDKKYHILNSISNIIIFVSAVYFGFLILWGLNYHRQPFSNLSGLEVKPATVDELADTTDYMIKRANELRTRVLENGEGVMKLESSRKEVLQRAGEGYDLISDTYPELKGKFGRPKGVLLSKVMSYTEIWGVYFPFTGEANVNMEIPESYLPCTACHEMAHQRGFAREDEANYISYLACNAHPDADFQYSGTLMALDNLLDAVRRSSIDKYNELYAKLSEGIKRDFEAISSFSRKYDTIIGDISNDINDIYLKSNNQQDGVRSYGRMVDLLIAEYRLKNLSN